MIFHQQTTDTFTKDMLIDAILKNSSVVEPFHFHFGNYPMVNTLPDALDIIEEKRKTLINPDNHTFLCLELLLNGVTNPNELSAITDRLADAINIHFHNDLFIISLVYLDKINTTHAVLCLSDIERSLPESSKFYLHSEVIDEIFANALLEFTVEQQTYKSLYLFRGVTAPLPYNGILHVELDASKK